MSREKRIRIVMPQRKMRSAKRYSGKEVQMLIIASTICGSAVVGLIGMLSFLG